MVHQHVDYVLKEPRLLGAEESTADLINHLPQLWDSLVVFLGVISAQGIVDKKLLVLESLWLCIT